MTDFVPIDDETARRLESLLETVRRETGRDVSRRELVALLVADADPDDLTDAFVDRDQLESPVPLDAEQREAFHSGTFSSGDPVEESEIDRIVYESEIDENR